MYDGEVSSRFLSGKAGEPDTSGACLRDYSVDGPPRHGRAVRQCRPVAAPQTFPACNEAMTAVQRRRRSHAWRPADRILLLHQLGERENPWFLEAWRHNLQADRQVVAGFAGRNT